MYNLALELDENTAGMKLGLLAVGNIGGADGSVFSREKEKLEEGLRKDYGHLARPALKALHPMDIFITYYKKFGYTYHVLPQLESVLRGKEIPDSLPPVAAMFMAELKNMILTAGHDLDKLQLPLRLRRSTGNEIMPSLTGMDVQSVQGDHMITDREGVISAILRGCDGRTAVTEETKNVLYTTYVPAGISSELIRRHLDDIEATVRLFSLAPVTLLKEVYGV